MILGLRTTIYRVTDLAKAKAWYMAAFGVAPTVADPFGNLIGLIENPHFSLPDAGH